MSAFCCWLLRPLWRFWIEPIRAEPVAAFRIVAGLVILWSTLTFGQRMAIDLGPDGLTPADMLGRPYDANNPGPLDRWLKDQGHLCITRGFIGVPFVEWWLDREHLGPFVDWCENQGGFWWFYAALVAALVCIVLGFMTRLSALVALLLMVSFHQRMTWVLNGGDAVIRHTLFYLLLMPAGATWSVDAWLRGRIWGKKPGPVLIEPWSVRLAMIQLCCIYFFTGLAKLHGAFDPALWHAWWMEGKPLDQHWLNGEAVYWVLNDNSLNRVPYYWLPIPMRVCRLLSWGTLLFEIGFPLLVLSRWTRPFLLVGGVLFHLGIWFHTEVGFFSPIMMAWYPLFLSGATLAWLVGRRPKQDTDVEPA